MKIFYHFFKGPVKVTINSAIRRKIMNSNVVFNKILESDIKIYGVTTGFGKLSKISINENDQKKLQLNLVRSHAAGVGQPLDLGLTRIVMFLKLLTYAKGKSGIRFDLCKQLMNFLNHDILPVIPRKGSVGASGDLAPMSHIALALIGEGDVHFQDRIMPGLLAMKEVGIEPLVLQPKEGLSLINGTQVSTALAIKSIKNANLLLQTADIAGALSVEASLSTRKVFNPKLHRLKNHRGQQNCASNLWRMLENSEIIKSHKDCDRVQDPYSFRCQPHVHGTSRDIYGSMKAIIVNEINSISDNPLIFEDGTVHNSGHFHAEPIAQALDCLSIAITEIGAISERRTHFMMKGVGDRVPPFTAYRPGLESGTMMAHVTAAALTSENKTLSHPASIDSLPTSAGQEDFVSMAPWAGRKALRIMNNVGRILAIEILVAATATINFHNNYSSGKGLRPVIKYLKNHVRFKKSDQILFKDMEIFYNLVVDGNILKIVEKVIPLK
ncbi:histidine ammonia-lyase [Candidatus Neomarinimicrobiota bacterium]